VHHHAIPAPYAKFLHAKGVADASGRALPEWSPESSLEVMEANDVATAILSVSAPGVHVDPTKLDLEEGRAMARMVNEIEAETARAHPGRFGFFATLPLPDVEGAIAEACHAFDVLGAAGVVLLANTLGRYLGDPADEPLFAELARRDAIVFVHPTMLPSAPIDGIPPFAADFLLDTTRAAYRLVQSGVVQRHPQLKIILSHAGGFVPYASHRLILPLIFETRRSPDDLLADFRSFYFDTALSGSPAALPSLLAFAKPGRVLFGSDHPFAPPPVIDSFTKQLDAYDALGAAGHAAIDRDNAASLFPGL
jgi:predicted TIM-barrel fold metal-dependent hydrolase